MIPTTINKEMELSKKIESSQEAEDDKKPPSYNSDLEEYKIATNDRLDNMVTMMSEILKHFNIDLENIPDDNKDNNVVKNDGSNTPDEVTLDCEVM
jgi:hypothetical protein